ncbi:hypothetical protein J6590_006205 [Homalodisca vitripennis]|nr:hypothetical protein J6590_006205 [Homalodisca vitripennis]
MVDSKTQRRAGSVLLTQLSRVGLINNTLTVADRGGTPVTHAESGVEGIQYNQTFETTSSPHFRRIARVMPLGSAQPAVRSTLTDSVLRGHELPSVETTSSPHLRRIVRVMPLGSAQPAVRSTLTDSVLRGHELSSVETTSSPHLRRIVRVMPLGSAQPAVRSALTDFEPGRGRGRGSNPNQFRASVSLHPCNIVARWRGREGADFAR